MTKNIFNDSSAFDEIDLNQLYKFLNRNKKLILFITSLATTFTIISTYVRKPIWIGEFQIILQKKRQEAAGLLNKNEQALFDKLLSSRQNDLKTQVSILKSPSILFSVFEDVKNKKTNKGLKVSDLDYKSWLRNSLDIKLIKGTSVLVIKYRDQDKDIILSSLNLISSKYQDYSKRDRQREIDQGISYLNTQKELLKAQSKESQKRLFNFSTQYSLSPQRNLFTDISSPNIAINNSLGFNAAEGFASHFELLEKSQAQLIEKSARLKPNSTIIKNLNSKIENLKESLKRPQEILAEYKTLYTQSSRDEALYNSLSAQYELLKLEKARQDLPWELISEPQISKYRFSPKRTNETLFSLALSFIIGCIISGIYELKSKRIFSVNDLKTYVNYPLLNNLLLGQKDLNLKIISKLIGKRQPDINSCLVFLSLNKETNYSLLKNLFNDKEIKFEVIEADNTAKLCKFKNIILIAELGNIFKPELIVVREYLSLVEGSIKGMCIVDNIIKT